MTWFQNIQDIICNDTGCDDNALTCLNSVDSGKDIDGIRAKDAQKRHVSIV